MCCCHNQDEADQLHALLSAIRNVNAETSMEKAIAALVKETCSILSCDRATVFMVDEITDELVLKIANNDLEIRIPTSSGIAGTVYTTGKSLKIDDPYSDSRFNQKPDKDNGYKTESILCLPVMDGDGNIVSVLQAINKMAADNRFSLILPPPPFPSSFRGGQEEAEGGRQRVPPLSYAHLFRCLFHPL
jgi:transcriptional regulator with GAF, ATPase, and Fis domain